MAAQQGADPTGILEIGNPEASRIIRTKDPYV